MNWNPHTKPPENICPGRYCSEWFDVGDSIANGVYQSLDEAISNLKPVLKSGCGATFGACIRDNSKKSEIDWYEPCEPLLKQDGLPWFYFISRPDKMVDELREKYIIESEQLWGKKHWD